MKEKYVPSIQIEFLILRNQDEKKILDSLFKTFQFKFESNKMKVFQHDEELLVNYVEYQ